MFVVYLALLALLCLRYCLTPFNEDPPLMMATHTKTFLAALEGGSFASKEDGGEAKILQYGGQDD